MFHKNKKIIVIIVALAAILLIVDRYYWAQISQWREDQATNIWLGYTAKIGVMPVGLISSRNIPNPNGMLLLGSILSILPNLLSISFFLGIVQIILLVLVGWRAFGREWQYSLLVIIPPLVSIVLRSSSIEFWNQYIITLPNIFFIYWALKYLQDRSLWNILPITILTLMAPSLYLAGIVNALAMTALTLGLVIFARPRMEDFWFVVILILAVIFTSIYLTWIPYFQNVPLEQLLNYNKVRSGPVAMFRVAWESLFDLPIYTTFQWAEKSTIEKAIKHADPRLISFSTQILIRLVGRIYLAQAVFAFLTFAYALIDTLRKNRQEQISGSIVNISAARIVLLSAAFIVVSVTFSSWLEGPSWVDGQRPDQFVQFLPMFLYIIFPLPFVIISEGLTKKIVSRISFVVLVLFVLANLFAGFGMIHDHLVYRGDVLTDADVPLTNKMRVIEFIAEDWSRHSSSNIIPVDYDIGGDKWDLFPQSGNGLLQWYPAPMTEGRYFDYELLRRYGLTNQQEGIQLRSFGDARYLITYAFESPPQPNGRKISHYIFGRLRVSILDQ